MGRMEIIDIVGVPEYYTSHLGSLEDAGDGMVRVVRCIERHGVLMPVYSSVIPAMALLKSAQVSEEFARNLLRSLGLH